MRNVFLLLLAGVLADNIICFRCIGIGNGILSTDTLRKSSSLGAFITAAGVAATAVIYPLMLLLKVMSAEYLEIMLTVAVCAAAVLVGKRFFGGVVVNFTSSQGAVAFGTVMGICSISVAQQNYLYALLAALFYGAGLLLVLCLFFCARLSVRHSRIPLSLRGLPLDLIIVSIISLIVYGWHGVA